MKVVVVMLLSCLVVCSDNGNLLLGYKITYII